MKRKKIRRPHRDIKAKKRVPSSPRRERDVAIETFADRGISQLRFEGPENSL